MLFLKLIMVLQKVYILRMFFLFFNFFEFATITFYATVTPQNDLMRRLDFLIQTSSGVLFNVLACGFQILHHTLAYQTFCLEDQNPHNLLKHFPRLKMFVKFLLFLEATHQSAKYLL